MFPVSKHYDPWAVPKMSSLKGGAVAKGGNSDKAVRSAKRNRYGAESFKMRYPTHYQYCMRLLTYTTGQAVIGLPGNPFVIPEIPTADTPATKGYNCEPEGGTQQYYSLEPRVAAPSTNGVMTMNSCGLYWVWGESLPTPNCPWLETYFAFKLDAQGFNLCDPQQFAEGCIRYEYVKQGPYCATFVFPDPPIGKSGPVRRYYPITNPTWLNPLTQPVAPGTLSSYSAANVEERGIGAWEMIIIPPRRYKSVNIDKIVDQDGWDRLIDMGFKPRPVTKVVKIYCSNAGLDQDSLQSIVSLASQPQVRNTNDPTKFSVTDMKKYKMRYLDTEDVCQATSDLPAQPNAGTNQLTTYPSTGDLTLQGYPCVPFGSALAFRFRQFAPVQEKVAPSPDGGGTVTYAQTCVRQTIPLDVYLDSVTTFKSPVKGQFDLDLPFTNPAVVPHQ